jgi:hypothetical protein
VEVAAEDLLVFLLSEKAVFQPAASEKELPGVHDEVAHLVGRIGKKNMDLPPNVPDDAFQYLAEAVPAENREEKDRVSLRHLAADILRYVFQCGVVSLGSCRERFSHADNVAVTERKRVAGAFRCFYQFRGNDVHEVGTPGNDGEPDSPGSGANVAHGASFLPKRYGGRPQETESRAWSIVSFFRPPGERQEP